MSLGLYGGIQKKPVIDYGTQVTTFMWHAYVHKELRLELLNGHALVCKMAVALKRRPEWPESMIYQEQNAMLQQWLAGKPNKPLLPVPQPYGQGNVWQMND